MVRRRDLPASVERHLIEPGMLDPAWRDRIRTLWEAWKADVDWNPERDAEPTIEDAAGWAGDGPGVLRLARDAIAADGIDIDPPDESRPGRERRRACGGAVSAGACGTVEPSTPNTRSGAASSMTPVELDCAYSMQLDGMVKAGIEKENLRHLALIAREAMTRRGAELSMPRRRGAALDLVGPPLRRREYPQARETPVPDHPTR